MQFNGFVYVICFLIGGFAVFLQLLDRKLKLRRGNSHVVRNAEFVDFRRRYLTAYLLCLFADSLQSPYLYYLYNSYGFLEYQIAVLYIAGFVTNVFFSLICIRLLQRSDRKLLCCMFVAVCSVACVMKFFNNYGILMIGRILDGVAAALLNAPFQDWYVHEHVARHDFPKEWIPVTFRFAALLSGYLAVAAGFVAEATDGAFHVTAFPFPFLLSIPLLIGAGFWIMQRWPSNRLDPALRQSLSSQLSKALVVIVRHPSVLMLSAVQALFESCLYMFVFLWTPLFLRLPSAGSGYRAPFGSLYATLMASALSGHLLHRILSRRFSAPMLLTLVTSVSFAGILVAVTAAYPVKESVLKFEVLLLAFTTYELAVGLYFPTMQRLQKEFLPAENRTAILSLFRIPLNLIAAFGLLLLHGREVYGNWTLLLVCAFLLFLCLMLSIVLQSILRRGANAANVSDKFLAQLQASVIDDDEI